mmetsp:Transcript_65664/g.156904  ORF Transcript_65664/g.156904 Transcript_65664/m.156904 type:complete len:93 (+) Transcript_65664:40-318(+)|eukprot:CAMPEP_0181406594 /NCGR_PEP_ID=MMETSP1110-20121109/5352_1 /TAXON_ID=174948 /ORGANISM="Symbiodinium sp., Strain CCMP421" /LENGTH=92 /DNA_ID=CAMNT_0023529011 /DNA_START=34 /DNA_END=312 /DNA_ORIENTATION=+
MCLGAADMATDDALPLPHLLKDSQSCMSCLADRKQGLQCRRAQFRTGALALSLKCEHLPEPRVVVDLMEMKVPDPDSQRHLAEYKLQLQSAS